MSGLTDLVIFTGLSGAGKSAALNCLEDLGYYCVDNLPPSLVDTLVDLCERAGNVSRAALVTDVRTLEFLDRFGEVFEGLKERHPGVQLIFLDASDAVLQQRFSQTRRPHPLAEDGGPLEGIRRERERLAPVRQLADRVIDTTRLSERELRDLVAAWLGGDVDERRPNLSVMSFGYRDGVPDNADLVFDVRFLPNPNYVAELKDLTGMDNAVQRYVESHAETRQFLRHVTDLLRFLIPQYGNEGKAYLTIAFGCTGGQHRSVAVARRVARFLEKGGYRVSLSHRDIPASAARTQNPG